MSLEFFDKENRPKLISTDFVMYRFVQDGDSVRVEYVMEGGMDDWTPLFKFGEKDYFIMSCNKFEHDTIQTLGLIVTDKEGIEEKMTDSIRLQSEEELKDLHEGV